MNIIKRVYKAQGDALSDDELVSRTISGSVGSFKRALKQHPSSHALAVFEGGKRCWRHDFYPDYKKDREDDPAPLVEAISEIQRSFEDELGLRYIGIKGYEADDIIASTALKARSYQIGTIIKSTDKDFTQLFCDHIKIFNHFDNSYRDAVWIEKNFMVPAARIADSLAMWGDKSDGVPGIPGIGAKKASELIIYFGGLEDILSNADKVKGKLGDKLVEFADQARISYKLVRLDKEIDIGLSLSDMEYSPVV